jgi:hypothetical protein
MLDIELLKKLYISYGFEMTHNEHDVLVFSYTKSRYSGVDIIPLTKSNLIIDFANKLKDEYSSLGYAVNLKTIDSNNEAEVELFKSFFSFDSTIARLKRKYNEFNKKQNRLLDSSYVYIECPFEVQNFNNDDVNLFNIIKNKFASKKAELIIIEAAAGYGKTCTAYEILKDTFTNVNYQIPIFTELARNRGVKKFRYILLDEIDIEYPTLNSQLVVKEIKNGRIPLIIDGFDELLDKVDIDSSIDNSFEEVETMLDTIGNLLEHKTKIVLTTRKTAIFTGEEFENWLNKWVSKFEVTRISLKEPRLKDWLGESKYAEIKSKNIPIQHFANPVILSFLKNLEKEKFDILIENPENLIDEYFERMLKREQERQVLHMPVEKQLEVFKNVVKMLLEFDCTSEDKEFFKSLILDSNKKLLEYTKTLYSGDDKHTVDTLVDALASHALLDRKGRNENQIGFVNDFVLGSLIGQILIETTVEKIANDYSANMIELAVTAYRVQSRKQKSLLWSKIQGNFDKFSKEFVFTCDIHLRETLMRCYSELTIYDGTYFNIEFVNHKILSSVFFNSYFKNCKFDVNELHGITFINCTFDNCILVNASYIDLINEVTTIRCIQKKCFILIEKKLDFTSNDSIIDDFEKEILEKLWLISNTKSHHIVKLGNSIEKSKRKKLYKCLESLSNKKFIDINGIHIHLKTNKIQVIKEILQN